jgi:hypothetical protein
MPWTIQSTANLNGGTSFGIKITNATALSGQVLIVYGYCWGVSSGAAPVDTTFLDIFYIKPFGTQSSSIQRIPYNFLTDHSVPGKTMGMIRSSDVVNGFQNNDQIGIFVVQDVTSGAGNDYTLKAVNGRSEFPSGIWWGVTSRYTQIPGTETLKRTYSETQVLEGDVSIQLTKSYATTGSLNIFFVNMEKMSRSSFDDVPSNQRPWVLQLPTNANNTNIRVIEVVFQSSVSALADQSLTVEVSVSGKADSSTVGSVAMQIVLMDSSDAFILGSPRIVYYVFSNKYIFMNNQMTFAKNDLLATRKIRVMFNTGLQSSKFWNLSDGKIDLQLTSSAYVAA